MMKIAILLFFLLGACNHQKKQDASFIKKENIQKFRIESPAFDNGGFIPVKYTADGENISPPLKISGTPQGTKSLALILMTLMRLSAPGFTGLFLTSHQI